MRKLLPRLPLWTMTPGRELPCCSLTISMLRASRHGRLLLSRGSLDGCLPPAAPSALQTSGWHQVRLGWRLRPGLMAARLHCLSCGPRWEPALATLQTVQRQWPSCTKGSGGCLAQVCPA